MALLCCRAIINIILGAICLLGFIIFRACRVPFYQSRLVWPRASAVLAFPSMHATC